MFLGIAIGYLARKQRWVRAVGSTTMITIVVLLFVMGGEIGGNEVVMSNLVGLGGEALLIAVAATLGSLIMARIICKAFFKGERGDERWYDYSRRLRYRLRGRSLGVVARVVARWQCNDVDTLRPDVAGGYQYRL